jgi:type IV secretory pathway TrbL component
MMGSDPIMPMVGGLIRATGKTWLGAGLFEGTYSALAQSLLVLGVLWTFCYWIYRRKVFIRT